MKIAKYPFAVLSAALFTVMLMTPISSLSNLIWLASVDMPIGIISSLEVILFDFQRLGIALFGVVIIGFTVAFTIAGLISKYSSLEGKYLYAVAGSVAIGMALILMVELLFQTQFSDLLSILAVLNFLTQIHVKIYLFPSLLQL